MGSPVSVVAEIVMQNIEEQALATYSETLPLWLRYVDDIIYMPNTGRICVCLVFFSLGYQCINAR